MASPWLLTGNAGTDPPADFLGTPDNQPLVIKIGGAERLRVDTGGNLGIGTAAPGRALEISAADSNTGLKITGTDSNRSWLMAVGAARGDGKLTFYDYETTAHRLTIDTNGSVGIGTVTPSASLSVVASGASEIVGTVRSGALLVSAGAMPPKQNNPPYGGGITVASLGVTADGLNNVSLGVRAIRNGPNGVGWPNVDIVLGFDVDDTQGAGAQLVLQANGYVSCGSLITPELLTPAILFKDGTKQTTAQLQGPPGPQGPPGVPLPRQIDVGLNAGGGGFVGLLGPGGRQTVQLTGVQGAPNNGIITVTDAAGAAAGQFKAAIFVDPTNGEGTISASVKNFRVPDPNQPGTDIVYACVEGPEAAAYVRGTAHLIDGSGTISLPDHFVTVVGLAGTTVHITPLSSDSRGLAVVEKLPDKILVKELNGGTGNYDFDWEVKGVRKNHEKYQVLRPSQEIALPRAKE